MTITPSGESDVPINQHVYCLSTTCRIFVKDISSCVIILCNLVLSINGICKQTLKGLLPSADILGPTLSFIQSFHCILIARLILKVDDQSMSLMV